MASGVAAAFTGDVLEIVLRRPERRNALGEAEWQALEQAVLEAAAAPDCDFVTIRGDGDFFCSGVDLALIESARQRAGGLLSLIERNGATLRRLERLPQLVIVAMNGPAVGIGTHLALCADILLARESAYLWIPEAKLGIPDVLHYRRLERALGRSAAVSMLALGTRLSVPDAVSKGLVGTSLAADADIAGAIADCLAQLRAAPKPVRRALKRYLAAEGGSLDLEGQVAASRSVLGGREPA